MLWERSLHRVHLTRLAIIRFLLVQGQRLMGEWTAYYLLSSRGKGRIADGSVTEKAKSPDNEEDRITGWGECSCPVIRYQGERY